MWPAMRKGRWWYETKSWVSKLLPTNVVVILVSVCSHKHNIVDMVHATCYTILWTQKVPNCSFSHSWSHIKSYSSCDCKLLGINKSCTCTWCKINNDSVMLRLLHYYHLQGHSHPLNPSFARRSQYPYSDPQSSKCCSLLGWIPQACRHARGGQLWLSGTPSHTTEV